MFFAITLSYYIILKQLNKIKELDGLWYQRKLQGISGKLFPNLPKFCLNNKARSDPDLHHGPVVMENNITTVFMMNHIL